MSFGDRIKRAREEKQFSQQQLGDLLDCTDGTISNYEKGVAFPRWDTVINICNILDVDPNYLFWDGLSEKVKCKILEQSNLSKYNKLNSAGQKKADDYIDDLLENPKYTEKLFTDKNIKLEAAKKKTSDPEFNKSDFDL